MQTASARSVLGRFDSSTGAIAEITASSGSNLVMIESGGQIGWGKVQTQHVSHATQDAVFIDPVSGGGEQEVPFGASIVVGAEITVAAFTGGDVTKAQNSAILTIANNAVTFAKQATLVQGRLIGRGGASGTGIPELLTIGSGLTLTGTELVATGGSGGDTITVNGGATASTDVNFTDFFPAAPAGGQNVRFRKDAANPTNVSAHLAAGDVSNTLIRDSAALSVLGRSANSTGDIADIVGADTQVLRVSGTTLGFGTIATGGYADNSITYAKLQNVAGFSVVGKASTGSGDGNDITAGTNSVLGRDGSGNVAFATVKTGQIADQAVELGKIINFSAAEKLLGRGDGGAGPVQVLGVGPSLKIVGAGIGRAALTGDITAAEDNNATTIATNVVSNTKFRQSAGFSVIGKLNTGTGDIADIVAGADTVLGKVGAGSVAFSQIVNAQITTGTIATAKLADVSSDILLGRGTASSGPVEEITIGASLNLDALNLERAAISGDVVVPLDSNTATIQPDAVDYDMIQDTSAASRLLGRGSASGAGTVEELTIGTGLTMNTLALDVDADVVTKVYRIGHTYAITGEIQVPVGDTNFIIPFFVSLATGQTASIVKARHSINGGTSATVKLQKNGGDITGYTGITVNTTPSDTTQAESLSDNDEIALVVTAVSATPVNMNFTIFIEYSQ